VTSERTLGYSKKFREKTINRASAEGVTIRSVAESAGIPPSTLYSWVRLAKLPSMSKKRKRGRPKKARFSAEDKLRLLLDASKLSEEDLGEFLRREGLHDSDLANFRSEAISGLTPAKISRGKSPAEQKVVSLEKELQRKDKALSEAAALLVLQKKFRALMEDEGVDMSDLLGDD